MDPFGRGEENPLTATLKTGAGIGNGTYLASPWPAIVGVGRSVGGHLLAEAEHLAGELVAPATAARDDPDEMYRTGADNAATALMGARATPAAPKDGLQRPSNNKTLQLPPPNAPGGNQTAADPRFVIPPHDPSMGKNLESLRPRIAPIEPFSGKDLSARSPGDPLSDPWLAYLARRHDDGTTGAPTQAFPWSQRRVAPDGDTPRTWRAQDLDFDALPDASPAGKGERSPNDLSEENVAFLRDYLGLTPEDFDGTVRNDNGVMSVAGQFKRNGEYVGGIDRRRLDPNVPTALHVALVVDKSQRGQGLSKYLLYHNVNYYRSHDINRVWTDAGDENGGYTWARFGFVPTAKAWQALRAKLQQTLNGTPDLSDQEFYRVKELLQSSDPKTIWEIADSRTPVQDPENPGQVTTLGSRLLSRTRWKGYMDLNDDATNTRFDNYVKDRPRW
jgi:GNAT superfamily N-acetyltransferase